MSKMGDWVVELQEDCIYLSREEFAVKHGEQYVYIWDEQLNAVPEESDPCSF
jgi:hypothetical protein